MAKVLKKDYREQIRLAKRLIQGVEVTIEEGYYQDLEKTVKACDALKIVADNIAYLVNKMEEE